MVKRILLLLLVQFSLSLPLVLVLWCVVVSMVRFVGEALTSFFKLIN